MVTNINKLKGKIVENGLTNKTLADKLGLCEASVRNKINEETSSFSVEESTKIAEILNLSKEELLNIFYGKLEFNS